MWDAGLAAISQIDAIIREHQIDCAFEWVDGYLQAPLNDVKGTDTSAFEEEATLAGDPGFDATFVQDVPLVSGPGIRFEVMSSPDACRVGCDREARARQSDRA